jgi:hypothetical protein
MTLAEDLLTDLDTFLDTDEFAVMATLTGGGTIRVILTPAFMEVLGVENMELEVEAKYSDISALVQNSTLVIGGVTYYIMQTPIDDGTGIARLPLSKNQV